MTNITDGPSNMTDMTHNDLTGMHGAHNMTEMAHNNMTDIHEGHNMTGMHEGHNMTGMHEGHNMTDMHVGHNMTGSHNEHGMHDQHIGHDPTEHTMKMYFHDGNSEYILFEDIYTTSNGGLVGACLVLFVVAVLYEGFKTLREVLLRKSLKRERNNRYSLKEHDENKCSANDCNRMFSCDHFLQVTLHIVQMFISYSLMLVFMTFNVWLCLAVLLGAGFGHFLFGWRRAAIQDDNEHCH